MFAKSKQIGLVSLVLVLGAMTGGCAESVGNEPASFPSQTRPVAFLSRQTPTPQMLDREFATSKVEVAPAAHFEAKQRSARLASPR